MVSTLFTFHVAGDSYWELREKADQIIFDFLREDSELEPDEDFLVQYSITYEMSVDENNDMALESSYSAEVSARIKPRRS